MGGKVGRAPASPSSAQRACSSSCCASAACCAALPSASAWATAASACWVSCAICVSAVGGAVLPASRCSMAARSWASGRNGTENTNKRERVGAAYRLPVTRSRCRLPVAIGSRMAKVTQDRHSHMTALVQDEVSLAMIHKRLGHKHTQTRRRYAKQIHTTTDAELRVRHRRVLRRTS